jgi:hypothetical protein
MEQPPPQEGLPVQFTAQQLLQQALAHHQALAVDQQQQHQHQHMEEQQQIDMQMQAQAQAQQQKPEGKEQTAEQAYQDVYHRLWKGLQVIIAPSLPPPPSHTRARV